VEYNYFEYRELISLSIKAFMNNKGYSRKSLSVLTEIDRTDIQNILEINIDDSVLYNQQIEKIITKFNLEKDYFLTIEEKTVNWHEHMTPKTWFSQLEDENPELAEKMTIYLKYYNEDHKSTYKPELTIEQLMEKQIFNHYTHTNSFKRKMITHKMKMDMLRAGGSVKTKHYIDAQAICREVRSEHGE
jgi:hypothetical protein